MILKNISFDIEHGPLIGDAVGVRFNPVVDKVIVRTNPEGNVMGGVVFTNFSGRGGSINIHVASFETRWINPNLLWVVFDYPFNQLGVKKIFGQVCAGNEDAIRFNSKLGFQYEALVRDVYPGDPPHSDMVLISMYRWQCRMLKIKPRTQQELVDG